MRGPTKIFSIFGQIEAVAAEILIKGGKAHKIPPEEIPETVSVNDAGDVARFAVIIPREHLKEFENLIKDLRA